MDPLAYDPLSQLDRDPFAALDRALGGSRRKRRAPKYPALTPEEETSLVDEILAKGASGLQYVGETLDKPGRAVRGVLSGVLDTLAGKEDPNWGGGLLNLIPFSDARGWTDPKKAVEGRDLLTKMGAPENQAGFFNSVEDSLWDVGGLATEILLDPLTYTGVGLLTKSGKDAARTASKTLKNAAKAGSILPDVADNFAAQVGRGERSLLSFGLGDNTLEWTGPGTAESIANVVGPAYDAIRWSAPGRAVARLVDTDLMNMGTEKMQRLAKKRSGILRDLQGEAMTPIYEDYHRLRNAGLTGDVQDDLFRQALEDVPLNPQGVRATGYQQTGEIVDAAWRSADRQSTRVAESTRVGVDASELEDVIGFGARGHYRDVPGVFSDLYDRMSGRPNMRPKPRAEEFKNLPGGSIQVNDIINGKAVDPQTGRSIWQMTEDEARPWLESLYVVEDSQGVMKPMSMLDPARATKLADAFYKRTHALDRSRYDIALAGKDAKKMYNAHGLMDEAAATPRHLKRTTYADMVHEGAAAAAMTEDQLIRTYGVVPEGAVRLEDALTQLNINYKGEGVKRTQSYLLQMGIDPQKGGRMFILPETMADMKRLAQAWRSPEELGLIAQVYDGLSNVWKTSMTSPWPAFHIRNLMGGSAYHVMSGQANNPLGVMTPFKEANTVLSGGRFSDRTLDILRQNSPSLKNIKDSEELVGAVFGHGFVNPQGSFKAEAGGSAQEQLLRGMTGGIPGKPSGGLLQTGKEIVAENVRKGKEQYRSRTNPLAPAGKDVPEIIDPQTGQIVSDLHSREVANKARQKQYDRHVLSGMLPEDAATRTRRNFGDPDRGELLAAPDGTIIGTKWQTAPDNAARVSHYEGLVKGGMAPEAAAMETRRYFNDPSLADPVADAMKKPGIAGKTWQAGLATADTLAGIGQDIGNHAESVMRLGHGLSVLANGGTLEEARASIAKWFFNYNEMTEFDRKVMRRIFPFWGWAKNNTPLVLKELIQNPGGKMAQSIRAINEGRASGGYVPEWIGGGGAVIPVGGRDGRFITSLGLPFESALDWSISPSPFRTTQRNAERTVASMNPLLKFGYQMASGRDPFSGRELQELYPYPLSAGNIVANAALAHSPASRAISLSRKIEDKRKSWLDVGIDALSGVKITDVPGGLDEARAREAQKAIREVMRDTPGLKQYSGFYVDPNFPPEKMTPRVNDMLRLQSTLTQRSRKRLKDQREGKTPSVIEALQMKADLEKARAAQQGTP